VLSFLFERGEKLALMRGAAVANAVLRGNSFFVGARFSSTRAP